MKYTNILEKLLLIFNIVKSSWVYIVFVGIIFVALFLTIRKKISKKACFLVDLLAVILLTSYTIYNNFDVLTKIFDNLMNNIFTNIYFPSVYAYLFILIVVNITCLISILKVTPNKIYKTINSICLLITNFIFALVLEIISKNEIDLFSKISLFSNASLVMLLEFTVNIFIVWIISNLIVYLTNVLVERRTIMATNKELTKKPAIINPIEVSINNLEEEYLSTNNKFIPNNLASTNNISSSNQYKFIPNNVPNTSQNISDNLTNISQNDQYKFIPNDLIVSNTVQENNQYKFVPVMNQNNQIKGVNNTSFDLSSFIPKQNEVSPITNTISIENIINNEIPLVKEEVTPKLPEERDSYTLNDYRIFNKMLKDIKEHNHNSSIISIDKNLEYRLITKYSTENYDMFKRMLKIYSN